MKSARIIQQLASDAVRSQYNKYALQKQQFFITLNFFANQSLSINL